MVSYVWLIYITIIFDNVGFDNDEKWHFLSGNEWKKANDVKAVCFSSTNDIYDEDQQKGNYYSVEYYDNVEFTMKQTFWIPSLSSSDNPSDAKSNSKLLFINKIFYLIENIYIYISLKSL